MDKNWCKIYATTEIHKAEILKAVLKDKSIEAIILNKQDSMYPTFNSSTNVDVYVNNNDVIEAKYIIEKHKF